MINPTTQEANDLNPRGRFVKLCRLDGYGKILDISDPEPFPKIYDMDDENQRSPKYAMNFTAYDTTSHQSTAKHRHWIDEDVLALLANDIVNYVTESYDPEKKQMTSTIHREHKGGPAKAAGILDLGENGYVARSLEVSYVEKDAQGQALRSGPVYAFRFRMVEGKRGDKGQITPVSGGKQYLNQTMMVPVASARKEFHTIQRYLAAKQSAAITGHFYVDSIPEMMKRLDRQPV